MPRDVPVTIVSIAQRIQKAVLLLGFLLKFTAPLCCKLTFTMVNHVPNWCHYIWFEAQSGKVCVVHVDDG